MTSTMTVERLIAEQEIRNLCYRYARGSDRLDADSYRAAFWNDGSFNGLHSDKSMNEVADDLVRTMGTYFALTHHLNGNILIDFKDAEHATVETYFRAFHLTKPDLKPEELVFMIGERRLAELAHAQEDIYDITVGGRYLDQVEQRDGAWKIKVRRLIFDYCTVQPGSALRPGEGMTALGAGAMARDKSDPSYTA